MANDEAGLKILKEMEAEKAPEVEKVEPKVEPEKVEPKVEPEKVELEKVEPEGEPRKVLYIPVGQVHAEKKKLERELRAEYEEKMKVLQTEKDKPEDIELRKKAVAEKLGLDVEHISELMSLMPKAELPLSKEDLQLLTEEAKTKTEEKQIKQQETLYSDEFIQQVSSSEPIKQQLTSLGYSLDEAKTILHDFVFTPEGEKYAQVPLGEIVGLKLSSLFPKKKTSAEKGSGGNSTGGKTFDKANPATPEDITGMSDKEFKEYSDRLGTGSRFSKKKN
jgi:hypothetical protein